MAQKLRFHLDEHVPHGVAIGLRLRGIDVTTSTDAELLSEPDTRHLDYGREQGRVVVTSDEDFLVLDSKGYSHAGIGFYRKSSRTIGEIIRHLVLMWEVLEPADMENHVEFL
jgi:hypothetical protein